MNKNYITIMAAFLSSMYGNYFKAFEKNDDKKWYNKFNTHKHSVKRKKNKRKRK